MASDLAAPLHSICRLLAGKASCVTDICSKRHDLLKMPTKLIARATLPAWVCSLNQEILTERDAETFQVALGKQVPLGTCYCGMTFTFYNSSVFQIGIPSTPSPFGIKNIFYT